MRTIGSCGECVEHALVKSYVMHVQLDLASIEFQGVDGKPPTVPLQPPSPRSEAGCSEACTGGESD